MRLLRRLLSVGVAGIVGACCGGVGLGIGIYLANITDRIGAFCFAGACAGFATAAADGVLRASQRTGPGGRLLLRSLIPASVGATVVLAFSLTAEAWLAPGERILVAMAWGLTTIAIIGVRDRRRHGA